MWKLHVKFTQVNQQNNSREQRAKTFDKKNINAFLKKQQNKKCEFIPLAKQYFRSSKPGLDIKLWLKQTKVYCDA